MGCESKRIQFLVDRDGIEKAKEWCLITARTYRRAVLDKGDMNSQPHFASQPNFRKQFIKSYLHFKRFALE